MSKPAVSIVNASKGKRGVITLSGFITDSKNTAKDVLALFNKLSETHDSILVDMVNLYGGSVYEGIPVYNAFRDSKKPVHVKVQGLVASMGAAMAMGGHTVEITRMSRLMIHTAAAEAKGNAAQLRSAAETLEGVDNDLAEIFATRTKMTVDEVKTKWFDGKDHYISASEAVTMGLADKEIPGAFKSDIPTNVLAHSNIEAVASFYSSQIEIKNQITNDMNTLLIVAQLNVHLPENSKLAETANETEVVKAINALAARATTAEAKVTSLEASITAEKDTQAVALVDGAIKDGKLKPAQKDSFTAMAKLNYAATAEVISAMVGHTPAAGKVNNAAEAEANKEFQGKSYQAIMNMKGGSEYLTALQTSNADYFNKLKAAYTKPVAA